MLTKIVAAQYDNHDATKNISGNVSKTVQVAKSARLSIQQNSRALLTFKIFLIVFITW